MSTTPFQVTNATTRRERVLDVMADLVIRQGYDKTSIREIAEEAGLGRGLIYVLFRNKDDILDALIRRELLAYITAWMEQIEADPHGGTIGGIYRAILVAIRQRPFMAALMRRDRRLWGAYLRKPGSALASLQSAVPGTGLIDALQEVGAIRPDADPLVASHILDLLSYGMVTVGELRPADALPPFDVVLLTLGNMLDGLLTPKDGGNSDAGKAVIRDLARRSLAQLGQVEDAAGENR